MQRRPPWADEVDTSSGQADSPKSSAAPCSPAGSDRSLRGRGAQEADVATGARAWQNRPPEPGSGERAQAEAGLDLDLEVACFVWAVLMEPDWTQKAVALAEWQADLQRRCAGVDLACPYWRVIVYDLNLPLYVEIELFVRTLASGAWPLDMLTAWQRRLRGLASGEWLPRRHWHALVYRANLRRLTSRARQALRDLLLEEWRRARFYAPWGRWA